MSAVGQVNPFSDASEYNYLSFVIDRAAEEMQTVSIVQVKAVDTGAQTVDVQVLVNIMTGSRTSIPHGVISARPYQRMQGGGSAIILDPVKGDIGIMVFGSRDLTAVIASKGIANPGSFRQFSWSDGIYLPGVLNGAPTQYIEFLASDGGINVHSPGTVTLDAPTVHATGDVNVDGDLHADTLHAANGASGTFTSNDGKTITVVDGVVVNIV